MISSIMVEKGPSMTRGVQSGIGGAVQIRTLMPEDIIREDSDWGMELKAETANNSTSVDKSAFGIYGMDYRDIPGATVNPGYNHLGLPTLPGGRDSPGLAANCQASIWRIGPGVWRWPPGRNISIFWRPIATGAGAIISAANAAAAPTTPIIGAMA